MSSLNLFKAIWNNDITSVLNAIYEEPNAHENIKLQLTEFEKAELISYINKNDDEYDHSLILLEEGQTPLLVALGLERTEIALILLNSGHFASEDMEVCNAANVTPIVMASMISQDKDYSNNLKSPGVVLSERELEKKINESIEIFDIICDLNPKMLQITNVQMIDSTSKDALQDSAQLHHLASHALPALFEHVVTKYKDVMGLSSESMGANIVIAASGNIQKLSFILGLYPEWLINNKPGEDLPMVFAVTNFHGAQPDSEKKIDLMLEKLKQIDASLVNTHHREGYWDTLLSEAARSANEFSFEILLKHGANPEARIQYTKNNGDIFIGRSTKEAVDAAMTYASGNRVEAYQNILDQLTQIVDAEETTSHGGLVADFNTCSLDSLSELLNQLMDYNPLVVVSVMDYNNNKTEHNKKLVQTVIKQALEKDKDNIINIIEIKIIEAMLQELQLNDFNLYEEHDNGLMGQFSGAAEENDAVY